MHLNINDLTSSNFLTAGGLLQAGPDQFILLLGKQTPVSSALELSADVYSQRLFIYHPKFWDFLQAQDMKINGLFQVEKVIQITRLTLIEWLEKHVEKALSQLSGEAEFRNDFDQQWAWSQQCFAKSTLQKTVPVTQFTYQSSNQFNFAAHLLLSLKKIRPGFIYGFWNQNSGVLGLTPELLASWDGKKISTMALAGTWGSEQDYEQVSDVDTKTREEHEFVINDIRERLGNVSIGTTEILRLPTLNHLKTEIHQDCLTASDFFAKVQKLHPTAALGIYPRHHDLMKEFSQLPLQRKREFFGAPFGVIGSAMGHVVVGIRNMSWTGSQVNLFVGCGVTAQSVQDSEWQELEIKKNAIVEAFSLQIS